MCLADTRMFMPGLNLTYTDRASMAASCEVRVPFVDPVVFEAAFALPGSEKIRGRTQKAALKDVARAWLPDAVIEELSAHASAVATLVGELTERLWGRTDDAATRLVRYCIDDIPVRLLITSRRASDPLAAYAVEHAVRGILRAGPPPA